MRRSNYSNSPGQCDEPEGVFPDGQYKLMECDKQNLQGSGHIDLWKLKLDSSSAYERLTYFSDYPGYKASNPVVSDDGRFIGYNWPSPAKPSASATGFLSWTWKRHGLRSADPCGMTETVHRSGVFA